jgi:hypothetical protein
LKQTLNFPVKVAFEIETAELLDNLKKIQKHVGAKRLVHIALRLDINERELQLSYTLPVEWQCSVPVIAHKSLDKDNVTSMTLGVQIAYLIACLEFCNQKTVTLKFSDDLAPIWLETDAGRNAIAMPMRYNNPR